MPICLASLPILPGSAAGAAALKSGQGPLGRGIAVRQFSPLRRREGPRPLPPTSPPRHKPPRFTVFCALRIFCNFSELVAQDGSTCANMDLKMRQHSPQDGPTWPQAGPTWPPRWTNLAPSWANMAPRWANIAPRWANIAPRWANIAPR